MTYLTHSCRTFDPSCYRCDLNLDEIAAAMSADHESALLCNKERDNALLAEESGTDV